MNLRTFWPMLLAALLAGFAGGVFSNFRPALAQQTSTPTSLPYIQAQKLEIIDQSGKVRLSLGSNPQTGAAGLSMFDGTSKSPRILIGEPGDGTNTIVLQDVNGKRLASLDLLPEGTPRLALFNSTGGSIVLGAADKSVLTFNDNSQRSRATIGLDSTGQPALAIYDSTGKVVWLVPSPPKN
jgi:hypothetical protein